MAIAGIGVAHSTDTILASGAKTATANGTAFNGLGGVKTLLLQLAVTAASGTGSPTLDVKLQKTIDGGTNWTDVTGGAFAQVASGSAPVAETIVVTGPWTDTCRLVYTIAGTNPSFTFSVKSFARA